jgi:regulator of CtrA degradation
MIAPHANQMLSRKVIEALMIEALLLNDEVRSYFEGRGRDDRFTLDPLGQVNHSAESVKATTRLMHISAWLMSRRSRAEQEVEDSRAKPARLGRVAASADDLITLLPEEAMRLVRATLDLYDRVGRLDRQYAPFDASTQSLPQYMRRAIEQRLATSGLG